MMRDLAARWLDPVFVREEEMALRIKQRTMQRRYLLSPSWANADQLASVEIFFGPPQTQTSWIIEAILYEWNTDANAGVRFPTIHVRDRNDPDLVVDNVLPIFSNPSEIGRAYLFPYSGPYVYNLAGVAQGGVFPLPLLEIMDEGISIELTNAQLTDTHRALIYYREVI